MGFALGGELCWLGSMLLIFSFCFALLTKILCQSVTVHKWTSKNQQTSQNIHPTDPPHYPSPAPPPPNLSLNKQEPQRGGGARRQEEEKTMTKYTASQLIIGTNCLPSASHPEQACWLIAKRSKSNTVVVIVVVQRQLQHMSVQ
jgi:hypothetical protein